MRKGILKRILAGFLAFTMMFLSVDAGAFTALAADLAKTEVKKEANKMIWVLRKLHLIEQQDKIGNLIIYKKKPLKIKLS